METLLYKHYLYDAWMVDALSIEIHERKVNNVVCSYFGFNQQLKRTPQAKQYTIDEISLEQIKRIIARNAESVFIDEENIEIPYIASDGVINQFTYGLGENRKEMMISNVLEFEKYEGYAGNVILQMHLDIESILLRAGISKEFLCLDIR